LNGSLGEDGLKEIANGEQPVDTLLAMMLAAPAPALPEILANKREFITRALRAEQHLNNEGYSAFSGHSRYSYDASIGIVYLWLTWRVILTIRMDLSIEESLSQLFD
jgi:hypothetical protein